MSDEEDYSEGSDEDYVPSDGEAVSEEECSGDEEDIELLKKEGGDDIKAIGKRKRQKKPSIAQRKRKGGIKLEGEEVNKEETEEEIKARKELEEKIRLEQHQRKAEQEKKKADDLWSSFMADVGHKPKPKASLNVTSNTSSTVTKPQTPVSTQVKPSDSTTISKKITITKEYDFAGETVKVTKEVDENSKEAQQLKKEDNKQASSLPGVGIKRPIGGLGSVLDKINKKQKISTLGKSKLDWDNFKKEYKLEDDLKSHNKGKAGYLDRVAFLNRTEQRQFEKERDMRLSQSSKR